MTSSVLAIGALPRLVLAFAGLVRGLLGVGLDPLGAMALAAAVLGAFAVGLWKGSQMRAHVAAADAGSSPVSRGSGDGDTVGRS